TAQREAGRRAGRQRPAAREVRDAAAARDTSAEDAERGSLETLELRDDGIDASQGGVVSIAGHEEIGGRGHERQVRRTLVVDPDVRLAIDVAATEHRGVD